MKTLNVLSAIICLFLLYACGGRPEDNSSTTNFQQSLAPDPVTATGNVSDINSKYNGKGVGRFTSVVLASVSSVEADKGHSIFLSKCVSCHTLNSDGIIGPGLKGVTNIRTPEWILNMIVNPEEMTRKDPLAKALMKKYRSVMPYQTISDEEAKQLLDFLRRNDSQ